MKRIVGFVMGIILTIGVMVFSLSACGFNKQIFDFTYEYDIGKQNPTHTIGSMVKRLRHRPFTAVTRVRFPLESL